MARSSTSSNRRPEVTNDAYKERLEPRLLVAVENADTAPLLAVLEEARAKNKLTENFLGIGLMRSSEKGKVAATRCLLEAGAKPDSSSANRLSPLMRAVERDHVAIVQLLLEHKANPDVADKKGRTVLMTAAWKNYWHTLNLLLQKGADINKTDFRGRNVLHNLAADKKRDWGHEVIKLLLNHNIHLDGPDGQDELKRSPLHWACATGKLDLAEWLLKRPRRPTADVHAVELRGKTCLHMAASHGRDDIVKVLIQSGAKINAKSDGAWTPLHNACEKGSEKIVRMLLNSGAEVNAKLLNGATPLHLAAQGGFEDVVKCLLECKEIKRAVRDSFGFTPFLRAAQNRQKEIVHMLASFNQVESLSVDALGASNFFKSTLVDFGTSHNQVKKKSVFELLYARDPLNRRKPATSILPRGTKGASFRWIHLPANNTAWIEALLTKVFIEEGSSDVEGFKALEKSFSHQHRGQQSHSHFMRPLCQTTVRNSPDDVPVESPAENAAPTIIVTEGMPKDSPKVKDSVAPKTPVSASGSADESRSHSGRAERDHGKGTPKEKGKKPQVNMGGGRSPKGKDSREHGKPYHGRHHLRSSSSLSLGQKDSKQGMRGNIFMFMPYLHFESDVRRQEMQAAISRAETLRTSNPPPKLERATTCDEMLIRAHLASSAVSLHIRRTLDQSFYHNIDTRSRDQDQVVYRYQTKHRGLEDLDPKILMVDQCWIYVLGKDLLVTSFPERWQQPKNDPLCVLDNIIEDINSKTRDPVNSVYDLAIIITSRCSGVFDRHRMGNEDYQFFDMFESSIGNATDRETMLFKEFNDASRQASAWLQHHRRPNRFSKQLAERSENDDHDSDKKFKFESFTRGTDFQDKLLDIGQETDLLAETKDIRDELGMMKKVLDDQHQVLPDLQAAICQIYEGEQKSQIEVKRRFREQLKLIETNLNDIGRMDKQAKTIYDSITDMLDLKQKHANAFEARFARDQAAGTARQSQTIMVFTIVTIIFLPLSFIAAVFAINVQEFPRTADGSTTILPMGYVSKYMFGIGFAVSIPLIVIALSLAGLVDLFKEARKRIGRKGEGVGEEDEGPRSTLDMLRMEQAMSIAKSAAGNRRSVDSQWRGLHLSPKLVPNGIGNGVRARSPRKMEQSEFVPRKSTDLESGAFR